MDPKPQMPDIKAEVNKVDDGKKKAAGLGGLFGGGGSGAAGGLGAGAAGTGGLLATKAGMLALVLMGSAVAGGIGLAGYKMFGPGDADRTDGNLTLFASKPPQAAEASAVAPVSPDGASASLNYMAAAAAKDKAADDAAAGGAAADPAKAAAAADAALRSAGSGSLNSGGGAGAVGSMGKGLANVKKLGALSGAAGGGASSASAGSAAGRLGDNLANASRNGASSAFSKGGPGAKASNSRGVAGRHGRRGMTQAQNVLGDQAGGRAASTFAAGRTYDGMTAGGGGVVGPDGGVIGMGGAGSGAGAQPTSVAANSSPQVNTQVPPVPPGKNMVVPWEKAVQQVQTLALVAMLLGFIGSKLVPPYAYIGKIIIAALMAAIIIKMVSLASQIMSGQYGQKTQGILVLGAAAGVAVMMAAMWSGKGESTDVKGGATTNVTGVNGLLQLGGQMVLVGLVASYFVKKPAPVEVPPGTDLGWIEIQKSPPRYTV